MKKSIVISHYNESLDWISDIDPTIKVYLYSKGSTDISKYKSNNVDIFYLENKGKEQQTYFYHIVNNYNTLEDIVYFTQANPFDHSSDFIYNVNEGVSGPMSDFNLITTVYGSVDVTKYKKHINHKYDNVTPNNIKGNIFIDPWNNEDAIKNINYIIDSLPELNIKKENWVFNANGLYSVTKSNLLKFSIDIYKKCLSLFDNDDMNMIEFAFERVNNFILLS